MPEKKKNGLPAFYKAKLTALRKKTVIPIAPLKAAVAVTKEPVPIEKRDSLSFRPIRPGEVWAKRVYDCGWFHITGELPAGAGNDPNLALLLRLGGEGLLYTNDNTPYETVSEKTIPADAFMAE